MNTVLFSIKGVRFESGSKSNTKLGVKCRTCRIVPSVHLVLLFYQYLQSVELFHLYTSQAFLSIFIQQSVRSFHLYISYCCSINIYTKTVQNYSICTHRTAFLSILKQQSVGLFHLYTSYGFSINVYTTEYRIFEMIIVMKYLLCANLQYILELGALYSKKGEKEEKGHDSTTATTSCISFQLYALKFFLWLFYQYLYNREQNYTISAPRTAFLSLFVQQSVDLFLRYALYGCSINVYTTEGRIIPSLHLVRLFHQYLYNRGIVLLQLWGSRGEAMLVCTLPMKRRKD